MVTVTSTVPAACAGVVTVIEVAEFTVTPVPGEPLKLTDAPLMKFVPVIVTEVPPLVGPEFGLTLVTAGAATNVN